MKVYQTSANCSNKSAYIGYEYPDGSYSLGKAPFERKGTQEKQYDHEVNKVYETVQWSEPDPNEYLGYKDHVGSKFLDDKASQYEQSLYSKLDPPAKLSQARGRYGQNGITTGGKRKVRSASALLEREYGNKRLGLCTVTLPSEAGGLDLADLWYLCNNWALFSKRFLQEFKRLLARRNAPTEAIAVTEFQEKRYERLGEPAPHLHILYVCSPTTNGKSDYYLQADELRSVVQRVLLNLLDRSNEHEPINCNNSVNLQRIKKSARAYLSKYLSKGGEILQKLKDDGLEDCIPNQWWSPIGGMRKWLKANIRRVSSNVVDFLRTASEKDDGIQYIKQITTVLSDQTELVVGLYIKVSVQLFEQLSGIKWSEPLHP